MKIKTILTILFLTISFASMAQKKENGTAEEEGRIKISIMYPYEEGKTFDIDYYKTKHMPMVAGYLGENLVKYTIEKGLSSGIPNSTLPYIAIGTFYVKNLDDYLEAVGPNRDAIRADFPNYTNVAPVILISEVIR